MALRARDVMIPHVVTVSPDLPLDALQDLLLAERIGGVPVLERGRLVGMVSRSDIVRALSLERSLAGVVADSLVGAEFAPGEDQGTGVVPDSVRERLRAHRVRDVMITDILSVSPDAPVAEVARIMVDRHVHRLPVVAPDGRLEGIIGSLDLVRLLADGRAVT